MSIKETLEKIKPIYPVLLILVLASISFALGRLSMGLNDKTPINIQYSNEALLIAGENLQSSTTTKEIDSTKVGPLQKTQVVVPTIKTDGEVIGSKSGKKYYFSPLFFQ